MSSLATDVSRLGWVLLFWALPACLVSRPVPERAPGPSVHEVLRRTYPEEEALRRETRVVVEPDGRVERDGPEREFFRGGALQAERFFARGRPIGVWRTWFANGQLRSETNYDSDPEPNRFWHPNGQLAAEGPARTGLREGRWTYWSEAGLVLREGGYHLGLRAGPWTFWEQGEKRAEGLYEAGGRVGEWTLWDAEGVAHRKRAADIRIPEGSHESGFGRALEADPR